MKILVITGGNSSERQIALQSAGNVVEALVKSKHIVEIYDLKNGLEKLEEKAKKSDIVFPVLHGKEGEGGMLQEFLEKIKVKFVGPSARGCRQGWDKIEFKKFCEKNKILTAKWQKITEKIKINLDFPYVIKPSDGGSSIDVFVINNKGELDNVDFKTLFNKYESLIAEEFIKGTEVTAGILNEKVLPVIEIRPPIEEWFSFENKYNGKTKEIPNAPSLTEKQKSEVQKIALNIHKKLGCKNFSRTDFIANKRGAFALELNTIPGLTKESLLPKAAKAAGISFEEMINKLVA